MQVLARWWQWIVARYHLVGWRDPSEDTGPAIWRTQQTLYWHRTYREASRGR